MPLPPPKIASKGLITMRVIGLTVVGLLFLLGCVLALLSAYHTLHDFISPPPFPRPPQQSLVAGPALAQLYDPNQGCVYGSDPNHCQKVAPPPWMGLPQPPRAATREDICHQRQEACMAGCVPNNGFYSCFGTICADDHTKCLHGQ